MKQKTIHLSFGKNDIGLYNELMRQSAMNYIPVSALVREYIKDSINQSKKNLLVRG